VVQKLLPKLHGSRKKLVGPLETLAGLCINPDAYKGVKGREAYRALNEDKTDPNMKKANVIYPISFEKIERMLKNAIENGFTSYAEA
jgi:5-methylcytosine-specific restriction protein B